MNAPHDSLRRGRAPSPTPLGRRRRRHGRLAPKGTGPLSRHRFVRLLLITVAVLSGVGMTGVAVAYAAYSGYRDQLPDPVTLAAMEPPLDSHVYARDGTLIATLHDGAFRHEHVGLANVSPLLIKATIDTEDKHFYQENSWDLPRTAKSAYDNLRGNGTTQGASTITQQLAKISFLPTDRTIDRKIKQVILGNEIDASFTKSAILEMYLNRIQYGNHAFGIDSAAQTYFLKHAKDLDLAEASLLAGIPNAPTVYNPLNHDPGVDVNPLSKQRQKVVLNAMVSSGDITQTQADAAYAEKLVYHQYWESEPRVAPDFLNYLTQYLSTRFGDAYITPGGWEITTSIDLTRQAIAEKTVHDGVAAVYTVYNAHDGALVSMDPRDGEVLAMVGTFDYNNPGVGQLNMATRQLQPGSTIKLFTYTSAIASRQFTMESTIVDAPVKLDDGSRTGYSPANYDRKYHGPCALAMCLGNSLNIPAVKVEATVGIPYITNMEIAAGLTSLSDPGNRPGPKNWAATLGGLTYGLTPLELVDGASTIASLGMHHDPAPVLKIVEAATNRTLYIHDPAAEGIRVVPENVAYIMSEITSNDHNRVAEFGANSALTLANRRASAKTGTTEDYVDNWTVGWTPEVATVVWVGNPSPSCLRPEDRASMAKRGFGPDYPYSPKDLAAYHLTPINDHCGHLENSTGVTGAAPIWHDYMTRVLAGTPATWYTRPSDVQEVGTGDDGTFYLADQKVARPVDCTYWGPAPDPARTNCTYTGTTPPPAATPPALTLGLTPPTPAPTDPPQ